MFLFSVEEKQFYSPTRELFFFQEWGWEARLGVGGPQGWLGPGGFPEKEVFQFLSCVYHYYTYSRLFLLSL